MRLGYNGPMGEDLIEHHLNKTRKDLRLSGNSVGPLKCSLPHHRRQDRLQLRRHRTDGLGPEGRSGGVLFPLLRSLRGSKYESLH